MIKVRLEGTPEEVKELITELEKSNIKILSESKPYNNRGNSSYKRIYLDVDINKVDRKGVV